MASGAGYMLSRPMEAMTTHGGAVETSFSGGTAYFTPPVPPEAMGFAAWLAERTPLGARTVAVVAPGARGRIHLPQIRPGVVSPTSWRGRRRRGSAPAFHAAYLHDVRGHSPRELAAADFLDLPSERSARHHIRDGRLTASDLGVWPWAVVDGKPLPRNWWADRHFALALQEWAVGELSPLAVSGALQPLRPRRFTAAARLPVA